MGTGFLPSSSLILVMELCPTTLARHCHVKSREVVRMWLFNIDSYGSFRVISIYSEGFDC